MLQIQTKWWGELQAIHLFTLIEHFRLQVSPCTALLLRRRFASRKTLGFFSRFSRQKRPWWFLETFCWGSFQLYLWAKKNSPKLLYKSKTFEESTHPSTLPVPHQVVQDDIWTSTHLIFWKIWTQMRPKIKGHQKNGSVPKWIEFDTNRQNTMNISKFELKPETTTFKISKSWGRRMLFVVP